MKKDTYFRPYAGGGWPELKWLEPYFLTTVGRQEAFGEQQSWGLKLYGVDGTENLERYKDRIDVNLTIQGDLRHGILLFYNKSGGRQWVARYSLGDPTKWRQWVETPQGDQMSAALFISFEAAWEAVKEFIERDGALPAGIEWIADADLPDYAFRPDLAS